MPLEFYHPKFLNINDEILSQVKRYENFFDPSKSDANRGGNSLMGLMCSTSISPQDRSTEDVSIGQEPADGVSIGGKCVLLEVPIIVFPHALTNKGSTSSLLQEVSSEDALSSTL